MQDKLKTTNWLIEATDTRPRPGITSRVRTITAKNQPGLVQREVEKFIINYYVGEIISCSISFAKTRLPIATRMKSEY